MKYSRPILIVVTAIFALIIFNLHFFGFASSMKPLMAEFGWSRGAVSSVFGISQFIWMPMFIDDTPIHSILRLFHVKVFIVSIFHVNGLRKIIGSPFW